MIGSQRAASRAFYGSLALVLSSFVPVRATALAEGEFLLLEPGGHAAPTRALAVHREGGAPGRALAIRGALDLRDLAAHPTLGPIVVDAGATCGAGTLDGRVLRLEPGTARTLVLVGHGLLADPQAADFSPEGQLFVLDQPFDGASCSVYGVAQLVRIDRANRAAAVYATLPALGRVRDLAVGPGETVVLATDDGVFRVDPLTRQARPLGGEADLPGVRAVAFEPGGALLVVDLSRTLLRVDPATGRVLAPLVDRVRGVARGHAGRTWIVAGATPVVAGLDPVGGLDPPAVVLGTPAEEIRLAVVPPPGEAPLGGAPGDLDGDGVVDGDDNCVFDENADQADADADEVGDVCDGCPADFDPREPVLADDFQLAEEGWTHAALPGGNDTWHRAGTTCAGAALPSTMFVSNGNAGAGCAANSSREHSRLVSPPIALPAAGSITLSFIVGALDEAGSCIASGARDAKDVRILSDGGATETVLNDCFPLVTPAQLGTNVFHQFDVSAFAGQTIQVAFVYDTLDATVGNTFVVDNVLVRSNVSPQPDADTDTVGDVCDNCPSIANAAQTDGDLDLVGNACDNCPAAANPGQENSDADSLGDACDNCPLVTNANQADVDTDLVGNLCDNCPTVPNPGQENNDTDSAGDACDADDDNDGRLDDGNGSGTIGDAPCTGGATTNCDDNCRLVVNANQADGDADGRGNVCDNCLGLANASQADLDLDGVGDPCDNCPGAANPRLPVLAEDWEVDEGGWTHEALPGGVDTWHLDGGACFGVDLPSTMFVSNGNAGPDCDPDSSNETSRLVSPAIALPAGGGLTLSFDVYARDEAGRCLASGDFDAKDVRILTNGGASQTVLNNCTALVTPAQRGQIVRRSFNISTFSGQTIQVAFVYDTVDGSVDETFAVDNVLIESNATAQEDEDADTVGDACDNCVLAPNAGQANSDLDLVGDACDNCPTVANGGQEDADADTLGDACDNCRLTPNLAQPDADADGLGDACDNCPATADSTALLASDFEVDEEGWTHVPLGGADTWAVGRNACWTSDLDSAMFVSRGNAGTDCATPSIEESMLLSPPVPLPAAGPLTLSFDAQSVDEGGACIASGEFDAKDVGISTDGGASYALLNDCVALTDGVGTKVRLEYDVTAWAGAIVQVVFVYATGDDSLGQGFAVDNVELRSTQLDADGDGQGDVCDTCTDFDGDGAGEPGFPGNLCPDDNCPSVPNPGQANADADTHGDACDCGPLDPGAFAPPTEIEQVRFLENKVTLEWESALGETGPGTLHQVLRGRVDQLPVGGGAAEICLAPGQTAASKGDTMVPPSGTAFYYLVRASNSCAVGTYGAASGGAERLSTVCP